MMLNILQFIASLSTVFFAAKIYKEHIGKKKKMSELKMLRNGLIVSIITIWIINILIGYVI